MSPIYGVIPFYLGLCANAMPPDLPPLIGASRCFLDLLDRVSDAAPLDRPVLVIGERGTGKELIAARLHYLSRRWGQALITINCAALPENLLESELFGHEAGAFTGAVRRRAGRFELADSGTLFLDEIANASLPVQEKVLRVSEYGEFERLGGDRSLQVDVRIIGATNADLPSEASAGRFRHDLLDRLSFDVLTIPPLRARVEDIPLLAEHFGRRMAGELGWESFPGFSDGALARLAEHRWPGNVRELRNVAERAVYRHDRPGEPVQQVVFDPFDSPYRPTAAPAPELAVNGRTQPGAERGIGALDPVDLRSEVAAFEREILERALTLKRFNRKATARHLHLSYDQLRALLRKHELNQSAK